MNPFKGAREMDQQLRSLVALSEDLGSVRSIPRMAHSSEPSGIPCSLWLFMGVAHTRCTYIHEVIRHIKLKIKSLKNKFKTKTSIRSAETSAQGIKEVGSCN